MFVACPYGPVKIGNVEIDQIFFIQDEASHSYSQSTFYYILDGMKVLENGAAFVCI